MPCNAICMPCNAILSMRRYAIPCLALQRNDVQCLETHCYVMQCTAYPLGILVLLDIRLCE
eukprot:441394-Pyramimonas_sp.AAC.1